MTDERPPFAWREVGAVVAVQAAVLLAMAAFYGPHRDELYFVSAGQRLAWGYPDQPSFTPFLARLATEVAPHHLVVLRLPPVLAVVGIVLLAVQFARLLGAARGGQVLTAAVVAASAVVMTLGHLLSTATFDTLAWTAVLVLATQAVLDRRPRLWLAAGVVAGVGLNNKHARRVPAGRDPGRAAARSPAPAGAAHPLAVAGRPRRGADVGPEPGLAGRSRLAGLRPVRRHRRRVRRPGRADRAGRRGGDHVQPADLRGVGGRAGEAVPGARVASRPATGARASWW